MLPDEERLAHSLPCSIHQTPDRLGQVSFISVDPYRIRNPYGYGKWSHNHRVYKTIKTIFVSLAPYKSFDILR